MRRNHSEKHSHFLSVQLSAKGFGFKEVWKSEVWGSIWFVGGEERLTRKREREGGGNRNDYMTT
jgi:hypothetical protein